MSLAATITIRLADEVSRMVNSRDVLRCVSEADLRNAKDVTALNFDFSGVSFLSRSAAHELLKIQDEMRSKSIEVDFSNTEHEVADMIRMVAANRALPRREIVFSPIHVSADNFFLKEA
jgi:hypothetical protein